MNTQDRELLELAAKAAEIPIALSPSGNFIAAVVGKGACVWNPIADDGDALRLALELGISVELEKACSTIYAYQADKELKNAFVASFYSAEGLRLAIVRVAAELGRLM